MTTTKAPVKPAAKTAAPTAAIIQPGETPFDAIRRAAVEAAKQRAKAPGSLAAPTEVGPGVVAQMDGTTLILAIETGTDARHNAERTDKGGVILGKVGNFGRTIPLPGTDLGLSLYLGIAAPKTGGK